MDWLTQQTQIEHTLKQYQATLDPPCASWPCNVATLVDYLHEHLFDEELSVARAKEACNIRNNNISIRFKRVVGLSIREYVARKRIEAARVLLKRSHTIANVAFSVGYGHAETFNRVYRRIQGHCPSESR